MATSIKSYLCIFLRCMCVWWRAPPFLLYSWEIANLIIRQPVSEECVSLRLRPRVVSDTCLSASERPESVKHGILQQQFIARRSHSKQHVKHDTQPNNGGAAEAPTAVYEKLWRILKASNLNESADMSSSLASTPRLCAQLNLFITTWPWAPSPLHRTETGAMVLLRPHAAWALCCCSHGPLLKSNITNWDIISKQPAGHHHRRETLLWGSVLRVSLFANKWDGTAALSHSHCADVSHKAFALFQTALLTAPQVKWASYRGRT